MGVDASFAGIVLAIKAITVKEMNTITQLPHPCNDKPSCYITPHKYNKGLSNEF